MDKPDPLLLGRSVSLEQAAQLLRVSKRTVYYRIATGLLRTIRLRGSQRVLVESLVDVQQAGRLTRGRKKRG